MKRIIYFLSILSALSLFVSGCAKPDHYLEERDWQPRTVAVMPFQLGIIDKEANRASSPITGAVYQSGPITSTSLVVMDQILWRALEKIGHFDLIERSQAAHAYNSLNRSLSTTRQALLEAGRQLAVDAVVVGFVYRFTQRDGEVFGVEAPASAAFDVTMFRVSDGQIMWRNSFDHTQTALTDNLLEVGQFLEFGLRWLTVEEFAQYGMDELLRNFPWKR
jgi:hypothetical protein